ncbi:histidinol-phosphate transaminase [Galbitalea sp. SE-J8]|uniref:histidinol-phosphate transaminase n=1 Tax=Galbitalea sp. SE-J8 TaxID=3054952 RepID=UPI00259CFC49|nr:histidinol-phosphate transaminase [Galbitalea sp. SE-J8]MDM4762316.1 histidinol-phosphate transaminase [Galbitalea sp. SE-J8]
MTSERVTLRPEIAAMAPYQQGKPAAAEAFKLSSNENPFDPLPSVREAIAEASVNRYPDALAVALRERLAERFGVSAAQVQVGSGSVAVLSQLITAAASVGDEIVFSWRSFEAYPGLVAVAGATSVRVPNTPDERHDLDAMAAAITDRTRVVIVCSPNNPTGAIVTRDEFDAFMATVPASVLVVLDEAYIEFVTDPSAVRGTDVLHAHPNLVLLRTFSKAYGLAGLRVGYAVGPAYVMDAARAVAIPLSVIDAAQKAAIVSLDHEDELLERVTHLGALRDEIWQALVAQGWNSPRPHGNFIWLPTDERTLEAAEVFARHGIVVRALGEGVRISIGEREAVDNLLAAAAEVVRDL